MSITLATGGNIEQPKTLQLLANGGNIQHALAEMSLKRKVLISLLWFFSGVTALVGGYLLSQPYAQVAAKIAKATQHTSTTFTTYAPDQALTSDTGLILSSIAGILLILVGSFLILALLVELLPLPAKIRGSVVPIFKGVEVASITFFLPAGLAFLLCILYITSGGDAAKSTSGASELGYWSKQYIGHNLKNDIQENKIGSIADKTYVAFSNNGIKTTYTVHQVPKDADGKTITYKIINRELLK
jgi:hypothetical protein